MSNNNIQITSPSFPVSRLHNLPPLGLQKTKDQENLQVLGSEKAWIKKNAEQPLGGKGYHMFIPHGIKLIITESSAESLNVITKWTFLLQIQ